MCQGKGSMGTTFFFTFFLYCQGITCSDKSNVFYLKKNANKKTHNSGYVILFTNRENTIFSLLVFIYLSTLSIFWGL